MTWRKLALQNVVRRKLRTLVTAAGVALAVAALFSLISFQRGYSAGMRNELDRLGAHVLIAPKGCPYDAASIALHGAAWPCYLKAAYVERVQQTEGVEAAAPLMMNALVNPQTGAQTVYVGADRSVLGVKRGWRLRGAFPVGGNDCLLGASVAQNLHLDIGQTFALPDLPGKTGRVTGILAPTQGAEDTFIHLPLATAQTLFKRPGELTHILVRLTDPDKLDTVVGLLRGCDVGMDVNVVPLTHLFRTIQGMVNATRTLLLCVLAVGLLLAGAGVSNTLLMAVAERTREIGVLRAIGASSSDVFRLIVMETMQICLAGWLGGIVLAAIGGRALESWLRDRLPFAPTGTLLVIDPGIALLCLCGAALLGSVAGLLPAWRAARLSPVEAIRG